MQVGQSNAKINQTRVELVLIVAAGLFSSCLVAIVFKQRDSRCLYGSQNIAGMCGDEKLVFAPYFSKDGE